MRNLFTRILALVLITVMLADPMGPLWAASLHPLSEPLTAVSHASRFQEDALSARSNIAEQIIKPFPEFLLKRLTDFLDQIGIVLFPHIQSIRPLVTPASRLPGHVLLYGDLEPPLGGGTSGAPMNPSKPQVHSFRRPGDILLPKFLLKISTLARPVVRFIERQQNLHDELSQRSERDLTQTAREDWERVLSDMTNHKVRILSNSDAVEQMKDPAGKLKYTPLGQMHENGEIFIKESLFTILDLKERNRDLAWILSYLLTAQRMTELSNRPDFRLVFWVLNIIGIRERADQYEFISGLMNLVSPHAYRAVHLQMSSLVRIPARPLAQISDDPRVAAAYKIAAQLYRNSSTGRDFEYPSGESYFAHATRVAGSVADNDGDAETICAALLHITDRANQSALRTTLENDEAFNKASIDKTLDLIEGLDEMLNQPFNPHFNAKGPDYTVQYYSNRTIQVMDKITKGLMISRTDPLKSYRWTQQRVQYHHALMSSLFILTLADKVQTLSTITPDTDPSYLKQLYSETICLFAPLAERLGQLGFAEDLRNEAFRAAKHSDYLTFQNEYRRRLGMTDQQAQAELKHFQESLFTAITQKHEISRRFFEIKGRQKSDESAWQKMESRRLSDGSVDLQNPWWHDLLGLIVIVDSPTDLLRLRDTLEEDMGSNDRRTARLEDSVDIIRYKGKIAYQTLHFAYDNPYVQSDRKVTGELQIMTREYYKIYLSGLAPGAFREAHWKFKAAREVNQLAFPGERLPARRGQHFDHIDPLLTGNLETDLIAFRDSLQDDMYPLVVIKHDETSPNNRILREKAEWRILKIPRDKTRNSPPPILADVIFRPELGGSPASYMRPAAIHIERDRENPESGAFQMVRVDGADLSSPLDVSGIYSVNAKLLPGILSAFVRDWLLSKVVSPQAALQILLPDPLIIEDGARLLEEELGDLADKQLQEEILQPAMQWLGINGLDALCHSIALAQFEVRPFRRLKDAFSWWIHYNFIRIHIDRTETRDDRVRITLHADENFPELLSLISEIIKDHHWALTIDLHQVLQGDGSVTITLNLHLPAGRGDHENIVELNRLLNDLYRIRKRRRAFKEKQDAERIDLYLSFSPATLDRPGAFNEVVTRLSTMNIVIESMSPVGTLLAMTVQSPPSFADNKTPEQAIKETLLYMQNFGIIDEFVIEKSNLNEATKAELCRFLLAEIHKLPRSTWVHLDFDPDKVDPDWIAEKEGIIDETFMRHFRRFYGIVCDYSGRPDPQHPSNNQWAKAEFRNAGGPYSIHLLNATWNLVTIGHAKDSDQILAQFGHDLFENGPPNVWKLISEKITDGDFEGIDERFPSLSSHFRQLARARKRSTVGRERHVKNAVIQLTQNEIENRLRSSFPEFIAAPLIMNIDLQSTGNRPYRISLKRMYDTAPKLMSNKLFERQNNLIDLLPRQLDKTVRYFLDYLSQTSAAEAYEAGRLFLLRHLVHALAQNAGDRRYALNAYYHRREMGHRELEAAGERETIEAIAMFKNRMADDPSLWGDIPQNLQVSFITRLDELSRSLIVKLSLPGNASQEGFLVVLSALAGLFVDPYQAVLVLTTAAASYLSHIGLHIALGGTGVSLHRAGFIKTLLNWLMNGFQEAPPEAVTAGRLTVFYFLPGLFQLMSSAALGALSLHTHSLYLASAAAINAIQGLTALVGLDALHGKKFLRSTLHSA